MNTKVALKAALTSLWKVLDYFCTSIFCGVVNAVGLVALFYAIDGVADGALHLSPAHALETLLEKTFSLKVDPLADTFPAFLLIAVLGYFCGCLLGSWVFAKRYKRKNPPI